MRLTTFIMLVFCLHLSAKTMSQEITLSVKDAPLKEIFSVIKQQTGYLVFYKADLIAGSKPVSVSVEHKPLKDFLDEVLKDQSLVYHISDKTILLFSKAEAANTPALQGTFAMGGNLPQYVVSGIINGGGRPLAGATVMLNPLHRGVSSDQRGYFEFPALSPGKYTITVTCIGYKKLTVPVEVVNKPLSMDLVLEAAVSNVEEVVVSTGYTTKKAGEITGSIQKISGADLRMGITTSDPVSLLKGRATGLYISEQNAGDPTSSGGQIFVRGQSSIAGVGVDQANQVVMPTLNYGPLLVLDGVIMPNQNLKEIVTPQEIEDVTILKDAAATAIYGSRAAGGVIVINTKKGKDGKPRAFAEVKYGLNEPVRGSIHFLTGPELYDLQQRYFIQDYQVNNASLSASYPTLQSYLDYRLPAKDAVANSYDWQKYAFLSSNTKEVNVNASGGTDRTKYYVGASYYNEQSTGVDNGLVRKSVRLNLESKLSDRLTASVAVNAILNDGHRELFPTGTFLYQLLPWATPYNANGSLRSQLTYTQYGSEQIQANPLYDNQWNYDKPTSQLIFGSAKLSFRITDWLSLSSTNSGNLNYSKDVQYMDVRSYAGSADITAPQGWLGTMSNNLSSYLTSNQLNFHKQYGEHAVNALAAMEFGKTSNYTTSINVNHVQAGYDQISLGTQIGGAYDYSAYGIPSQKAGNVEGGQIDQAVYSLFGEAEYSYARRYTVSGSVRRDASSAFGANRRYGTFYSAGGAWMASNEAFLKNSKVISNLKLHASYGTSGSQLGDNFLTQTLYRPGTAYTYAGQQGMGISNIANTDLRWEVTKTASAGFDLGLFNKVNATVDAYTRRSDNLLQQVILDALAGFPNQWQNVASVRNTGIEVLVNADIIRNRNFSWTTNFNISYNHNSIVKVARDSLKQGFYTSESFYLHPGEDINSMKAIHYAGVDPETGKPRFEKLLFDADGHNAGHTYVNTPAEVGQASDTRQMQTVGSFQPRYYGGFANTFTYKRFALNVLITYALKYVMHDGLAEQMQRGYYMSLYNQLGLLKSQREWTQPGQTNATEPWLYYQVNTSFSGTDKYIHDASNVRLRSVRLNYSLPDDWMKRAKLAGATVYVSGDNLYTRFSRKIVTSDPEGPSVGQAQDFGESVGSNIGAPRRYVFGLQVNF
ncbi:SusC/RagA family TonB-linked outer membrane protein [Chitinophaga parva]|nr:SusC/RagA family TonB-linked outer membrane protein [Chitinophaga parva]